MRILWVVNIILPQISEAVGENKINCGGWLTSLMEDLKKISYGVFSGFQKEERVHR